MLDKDTLFADTLCSRACALFDTDHPVRHQRMKRAAIIITSKYIAAAEPSAHARQQMLIVFCALSMAANAAVPATQSQQDVGVAIVQSLGNWLYFAGINEEAKLEAQDGTGSASQITQDQVHQIVVRWCSDIDVHHIDASYSAMQIPTETWHSTYCSILATIAHPAALPFVTELCDHHYGHYWQCKADEQQPFEANSVAQVSSSDNLAAKMDTLLEKMEAILDTLGVNDAETNASASTVVNTNSTDSNVSESATGMPSAQPTSV